MVQGHTAKAAADQGDSTLCPRPGSHRRGQGRGGQPALGLKPHGPPHPVLLCPSPLRIGTAMKPWKAQPSPLLPGQDGGDLITQPSSRTETVSWGQPWSPSPGGTASPLRRLSPAYCRFSAYSGRPHLTGVTHPGNSIKACGHGAGALPSHGDTGVCGCAASAGLRQGRGV